MSLRFFFLVKLAVSGREEEGGGGVVGLVLLSVVDPFALLVLCSRCVQSHFESYMSPTVPVEVQRLLAIEDHLLNEFVSYPRTF